MLSRVSIQSKLLVMLLLTSILSAAVVGAIGYQSGRSLAARLGVRPADRDPAVADAANLQTAVRGSEEFAGGLLARLDGDPGHRGLHRGLRPARRRDDQPGAAAVARRLLQQRSSPRPRKTQTGDQVDVDALLPTSNAQRYLQALLHRAVHRLGRRRISVRRRPRRQRVVGGQRPVQRLLPRDRHALRIRGRPAARHQRATSSTAPTRASTSAPTCSPVRTRAAS